MKEIKKLISTFELSPTIMNDIKSKYQTLYEYLDRNGLKLRVFPQGSIAYGTAVRPYSEDEEKEYDLDIICCIDVDKNTSAREIREKLTTILNTSGNYLGRIKIEESCITLVYSGPEDFTFKIDILASRKSSGYIEGQNMIIEYAKYNETGKNYTWVKSGAEAFISYFNDKNFRFLMESQNLYVEQKDLLSVTEIPEFEVKSEVQNAIQILKRLRDVYYTHKRCDDKISSHFITFAVLDCLEMIPSNSSTFDIIRSFTNGIERYMHKDGEYISTDPIMNENMITIKNYKMFNDWIEVLKRDLDEIFYALDNINDDSISILVNNFGKKSTLSTYRMSEPVIKSKPAKPWGSSE